MDERGQQDDRAREIIERARANERLMEGVRESLADVERGERGVAGKQVREEARARRARL